MTNLYDIKQLNAWEREKLRMLVILEIEKGSRLIMIKTIIGTTIMIGVLAYSFHLIHV